LADALAARLRSYGAAVAYAPNQAYVGNRDPETLRALPRPWFAASEPDASSDGVFGDIVGEAEVLGLGKLCDRARLLHMDGGKLAAAGQGLTRRRLVTAAEIAALACASDDAIARPIASGDAIPLWLGDRVAGSIARGHEEDEALTANVLLENLVAKSTGVL